MLQAESSENCRVNDKNSGVGERIAFFFITFTLLSFEFMCSFSISSMISLYSISSVCESLAVRSSVFRRALFIGGAPNISDGNPVARYSGCVACRTSLRGCSFLFVFDFTRHSPLAQFAVSFLEGSIVFAFRRSFLRLPRLEADCGRLPEGRRDETGLTSTSTSCRAKKIPVNSIQTLLYTFFLVGYVEERLWWPIQSPNIGGKKKGGIYHPYI